MRFLSQFLASNKSRLLIQQRSLHLNLPKLNIFNRSGGDGNGKGNNSDSSDDEADKKTIKKRIVPIKTRFIELNAKTRSSISGKPATGVDDANRFRAQSSKPQPFRSVDDKRANTASKELNFEAHKASLDEDVRKSAKDLSKMILNINEKELTDKWASTQNKRQSDAKGTSQPKPVDFNIEDMLSSMTVEVLKKAEKLPEPELFDKTFTANERTGRRQKLRSTDLDEIVEEQFDDIRQRSERQQQPCDLYGAKPLNIFTHSDFKPLAEQPEESVLWKKYREWQLKTLRNKMPLNGFDETIRLTNDGKLWHLPIDNEQGLNDEDMQMPFYEHVLLDHFLDDFPKVDCIRNFMKLVLNGLSRNAFLSVKEKHETIQWYKNYFSDKLTLIEESLRIEQLNRDGII